MNSTTSLGTIERLRAIFAAYGLPKILVSEKILVSDNGPQLVSNEFEEFLSKNGVKHVQTVTYKPFSSGEAEQFVKTFTQSLVKSADSGNMFHRIAKFIFSYRNTPNTVTGETPSEYFLNHKIRTKLSLIFPDPTAKMTSSCTASKLCHDLRTENLRVFKQGDYVLVIDGRGGNKSLGKVMEKLVM
jgi:hypothetical protein